MVRCGVLLLFLGLQCTCASMADGWGMPKIVEPSPKPVEAVIPSSLHEHAAREEQVVLTKGGALHKVSGVMRREQEAEQEEDEVEFETHHHKHHNNIKAMFERMDKNGDGALSNEELKGEMERIDAHHHVKVMHADLHSLINSNRFEAGEKKHGMSYHTFKEVVLRAAKSHVLQKVEIENRHKGHRSSGHKHRHQDRLDLLEEKAEFPDAGSEWVSCGGHKAETCSKCPVTDASGTSVFNHGQEWCHGDCIWDQGSTSKDSSGVLITCFSKEGYVHSGAAAAAVRPYQQTTPLPDLLNPNLTKRDEETINAAATDAIKEENMESAEKMQAQEQAEEDKKFSWGKFWLITIVAFSIILGICAVVSIVALVVFCFMANPGPPVEKGDDEAALAGGEGEGEAEGEDAGEAVAEGDPQEAS